MRTFSFIPVLYLLTGLIVFTERNSAQPITLQLGRIDSLSVILDTVSNSLNYAHDYAAIGYGSSSVRFENRAFFSWNPTSVPTNKTIKTAILRLNREDGNGIEDFAVYNVPFLTSSALIDSLWNATISATPLGTFHVEIDGFSFASKELGAQIIQAMQAGYLTLGFRYFGSKSVINRPRLSAQLDVVYLNGDTMTATITNEVNGIMDYSGSGSFVRADNGSFFAPPVSVVWEVGGDYSAETWFTRYIGLSDSIPEKFSKWNKDKSRFHVSDDINDYDSSSGIQRTFIATSENLATISVSSEFEGYGDRNVQLQFLDPWRVYHPGGYVQLQETGFVPQTSPYSPQSDSASYGVFLNKLPPWIDTVYSPYYSIRVARHLNPSLQVMGDTALRAGDWVFVGITVDPPSAAAVLEDNLHQETGFATKAVVFLEDDAQITVHYKRHLMSSNASSPTPTLYNNQRKIAFDGDRYYHMVYESEGAIWYLRSTDLTQSWSDEMRVNDWGTTAKLPCISGEYKRDYLIQPVIAFVQNDSIVLKQLEHNTRWVWRWSHPVDPAYPNPVPSVEADARCGEAKILVVWSTYMNLGFAYLTDHRNGQGAQAGVDYDLLLGQGRSVQPEFPSISKEFEVAWRERESIYSIAGSAACFVDTVGFDPPINLQNRKVYPAITPPSISSTYTNGTQSVVTFGVRYQDTTHYSAMTLGASANQAVFVARKYQGQSSWGNYFRLIVPGNFSTWQMTQLMDPGSFVPDPPLNPSIGLCVDGKDSIARVAYNYAPTRDRIDVARMIFDARTNSTTVLLDTAQADGRNPSLTSAVFLPEYFRDAFSLLHRHTYPSWSEELQTSNSSLTKMMSSSGVPVIRELNIEQDSAIARCGIANIHTVESGIPIPLSFTGINDSLAVGLDLPINQAMRSSEFTIENSTELAFDFGVVIQNPFVFGEDAKFALKVIELPDSALLYSEDIQFSEICTDSMSIAPYSLDLSQYAGLMAFVSVSVSGLTEDAYPSVVDIFRENQVLEKQHTLVHNIAEAVFDLQVVSIPGKRDFQYLRYTIPDEASVDLALYDIFGRRIRTIRSDFEEKGRYMVPFESSFLSTGAYFVRLVSGVHIQTRKIIITR